MLWVVWLVLGIVLLQGYAWLMLAYWRAWQKMRKPSGGRAAYPQPQPLTVLVPARNEAGQIITCLSSLLAQDYPSNRLDIIVIDDDSTDETRSIVAELALRHPQIRCIPNTGSGKKAAIQTGIEAATSDWVVCTDADCTHTPQWLTAMHIARYEGAHFVAGPVLLLTEPGVLAAFQQLDFMMMQGITAAAVSKGWHSMCNGANIAYRRQDFFAVGGFAGIDAVPTGDDMLLMHKINEVHPGKAVWLRNRHAIVSTPPCHSWQDFLQQRIRWGSKATVFSDKKIFWVLLLVYCLNLWLFISLVAMWWVPLLPLVTLVFFLAKIAVEFPLIYAVSDFFGLRQRLHWFVLLQPLHVVYVVVAGWLGQFGSYQWKGRTVETRVGKAGSAAQ